MTTTINQRIKELIFKKDLNVSSFSRKVGLSGNSVIHNILSDETRKPSYQVLESIAQAFPDVSSEWLLRGEGTMINNNDQTSADSRSGDMAELLKEFKTHNEYMRQLASQFVKV